MLKNSAYLILIFSLLFCAGGCGKDNPDLSVLYGQWETVSIEITVEPHNLLLQHTAHKNFPYDAFRLEFREDGKFYEAHSIHGNYLTMTSGDFFYNHGYKARFEFPSLLFTTRNLEVTEDRLFFSLDLTSYYRNSPPDGFEEYVGDPFEKIEARFIFERAGFYSLFDYQDEPEL